MRGLDEELAAVLPDEPEITISRPEAAHERVDITWGDGRKARLDVYQDRVYWHSLRAPMDEGPQGLYTLFCKQMPKVFRKRGVSCFEMTVDDPHWREVYLKRGKWKPAEVEYAPDQFADGFRWKL